MKRLLTAILVLVLLSGFSAYALGASAPDSYAETIEDIQALCEQGEYEQAYGMIRSLPPCAETASLLDEMIELNTVDMTAVRADYSANSVRAEKMYSGKFFFIRGIVSGFDTPVFGDEMYMILDIEDCSDYVHCYGMTEEELLSVNSGDEVIVAGNYSYDYGWIGIDFKSCSIVDPAYLNATESIKQEEENAITPAEGSNADDTFSTTDSRSDFQFCPNCGERLDTNGNFCPFCGAQIKGTSDAPSAETPQNDTAGETAFAGPDEWYKAYEGQDGYYLDTSSGWTLAVSYIDGEIVAVSDNGGFMVNHYNGEYTLAQDGKYVYSSLSSPGDEYMDLCYDQTDGSLTTMGGVYFPMLDHGDQYAVPAGFDKNWYWANEIYSRDYSGPYGTATVSGYLDDLIDVTTVDYGFCSFDANDYEGAACGGVYYKNNEGKELYYYPDLRLIMFVDSSGGCLVGRNN